MHSTEEPPKIATQFSHSLSAPLPPRRARMRPIGLKAALVLALATMVLFATGCSPTRTEAVAAKTAGAPWNWEFYQPLPRMRLASLPCQLLPKSSIAIPSPLAGSLKVYVHQPQASLPAGYLWAEFEPAILANESNALALAKAKLDERERIQMELEYPKQKLRIERELEEAERQYKLLRLLSTNQELAQVTFNFAPLTGSNPLKPEAVDKAQHELGLLEKSMTYIQQTNLLFLGVDLPGERSEWERRQLDFENRQARARLKMPFRGQLTLNLPITEGVEEYPVNAGTELGVARDLSIIRLRIVPGNPAWVSLPPDQLTATLRLPSGEELQAAFAFQKIERVQLREESVYYFEFSAENSPRVSRLLGTELNCELWLTLPRPARIVPKFELVMRHPEAFQGRTWAEGIQTAWPGAKLLVEGQTALAIVLPKDTTTL